MMKPLQKTLRAAIVQAAPLLFDKEGTLDNVCRQIGEAGRNGARLIVFPESLIPCYPYGLTFGFTVGSRSEAGRRDWKTYYDNALAVPGNDTRRIGDAAKEADAYVSIGITERDRANASLYCTNLIFGPDGTLLAKHRKIKPTGAERYIWADSHDKATYFPVTDTPWGPRWAHLFAGKTTCPWPASPSMTKAYPSTSPRTRTTIPNGRTRSVTLPSKAIAMSSTPTNISPKPCTPPHFSKQQKSPLSTTRSAVAAAVSLILTAIM